jgi:hypothetical protein
METSTQSNYVKMNECKRQQPTSGTTKQQQETTKMKPEASINEKQQNKWNQKIERVRVNMFIRVLVWLHRPYKVNGVLPKFKTIFDNGLS